MTYTGDVRANPPQGQRSLRSLAQVYRGVKTDVRFVVLQCDSSVVALDIQQVSIVTGEPFISVRRAITEYENEDHAVVSCVMKSTMELKDKWRVEARRALMGDLTTGRDTTTKQQRLKGTKS